MTLPSVPPITLLQALAEYGIPAGYTLGHLVNQPGMPTSYPITLLDCLGKSNIILTPYNGLISESGSGNRSAGFLAGSDGMQYAVKTSGTTALGAWINVPSLAGQCEFYMEVKSGPAPSGLLNQWVDGLYHSQWSVLRSVPGTVTTELYFTIRRDGNAASQVTTVVTLQATQV